MCIIHVNRCQVLSRFSRYGRWRSPMKSDHDFGMHTWIFARERSPIAHWPIDQTFMKRESLISIEVLYPPRATSDLSVKKKYTVGHKSHEPCLHKKYMETWVMTFVAHCTSIAFFLLTHNRSKYLEKFSLREIRTIFRIELRDLKLWEMPELLNFRFPQGWFFFKLWQYWTKKILENKFCCFRTASLGSNRLINRICPSCLNAILV